MFNFKIKSFLTISIIFMIFLLSIGIASANNTIDDSIHEQTTNSYQEISDTYSVDNKKQVNNIDMGCIQDNRKEINKKIINNKEIEKNSNETSDEELTNDCSTCIIQVSENESVLSFRRDSTGSSINIYVENNSSHVKQYKTTYGYFFHVLIDKNGWLVGTGGADSVSINKKIESKSLSIINNDKITRSDLDYVASLHRQLGLGHFLIKAPDGRYGFEIYSGGASYKQLGTIKNGQYIVCPNSRSLYKVGYNPNYINSKDIVRESRLLALKDPFGVNRRNIMTYHFKNNIVNTTIDFYVSNDDGSYVGRRTAYLSDNIQTKTRKIYSNSIPRGINGIFVQSYLFKLNPKVNFSVTTNKNTIKMGETITFTAKLTVNDKAFNKGYVIFKLNGKTIKSNNLNIKSYLHNSQASLSFIIPDGWSAKSVKVTAVYSLSLFGRLENKTYFLIEKSNTHQQLNSISSQSREIKIKGNLLDEHNHRVLGTNTFAIKINGITLKNENGKTTYFEVRNGIMDITFKLPENYKIKQYNLTLITGSRLAYNDNRHTYLLNMTD